MSTDQSAQGVSAEDANKMAGQLEVGDVTQDESDMAADMLRTLVAERDALSSRVRELEGALRFYADVADYKAPFTSGMGKLWHDCGETARAALTTTSGDSHEK